MTNRADPLQQLEALGQSVWYDNIRRRLLVTRGLERLIQDYSVVGVTSNPTIFHKAITETGEYDNAIAGLRAGGASTQEVLDALTTQDIAMAADQLRPTFRHTDTVDGWVSIEVAPGLAHDIAGTVAEAHRLRSLVDRPNVLVKVPATAEGAVAFRELTAQGVSVNVTLIFSLERYGQIMEAYLAGLEDLAARPASGRPAPLLSGVRSVASFFVSRVDTLVDARLRAGAQAGPGEGRPGAGRIRGRAAGQGRGGQRQARVPAVPRHVLGAALGGRLRRRGPGCSGRSGPAPAPRTRPTGTWSTWRS